MQTQKSWLWTFGLLVTVMGTGLWLISGCPTTTGGGGEDEDLCADVQCPDGQECDPDTGNCVAVDPCEGVECPDGEECVDGVCEPVVVECDPPCADGEECVDGVCEPVVVECDPPCADDEECVDGVCEPVVVECDPPCADGEECVDGVCEPVGGGVDGAAVYADNGCNAATCHGADGMAPIDITASTGEDIFNKMGTGLHAALTLTQEEADAIAEFLGG